MPQPNPAVPAPYSHGSSPRRGDPRLAARIAAEIEGEVLFDAFSRGRYSTDASIYQLEPIGIALPKSRRDLATIVEIARDENVPLLMRGGGTSQCGQTVGEALVVDVSKHLNRIIEIDRTAKTATVEPGLVLDSLNSSLKGLGLQFAVDISTGSRATLGGMCGNNSCGARSLRYGTMRDNVLAVDALLADGSAMQFGEIESGAALANQPSQRDELVNALFDLGAREATEIDARFPKLMRRVGGYNIDALLPGRAKVNLAHLLVGSEGTLAVSTRIKLKLSDLPHHKLLGVCHFPTFYHAMDAAQHIVKLDPTAVELVDRTMVELSRDIPLFRDTVARFVVGEPDALLLVEFAECDPQENARRLSRLGELMGDLGFPGAVVEAVDPEFQKAIWDVRKAGLNIMMSMKGDGKPISFIEDCAVPLENLAEYTRCLDDIFRKHGTSGTWYAHASVGCLHVRPILNLKLESEAKKMRVIAEEAFEMVREYKGSHSGEHGDGLVRSEFHLPMFGERMVSSFKEVKQLFDPGGRLNPGKIVDPPKMDDRTLFRFKPGYKTERLQTALDWSAWGGFAGAAEMCNNNGACRSLGAEVMCPSYRVTRDEKHVTRGRANSLRLALSGQLPDDALVSEEMADTLSLCVGCKGCKRECPTGVDMARMKIEVMAQRARRHGLSLHDRLVGYLPRYAPLMSRLAPLVNLRDRSRHLAKISERLTGFTAERSLPAWRRDPFTRDGETFGNGRSGEVVLLADCFNRYFEPENLDAAIEVLCAAGCRVIAPVPKDSSGPLCCGRTFLSVGLVAEARREAERLIAAYSSYLDQGATVVGLEPSCLYTLRDEYGGLLSERIAEKLAGARMFEEHLIKDKIGAKLQLGPLAASRALLHGHCHQKAFGAMASITQALKLVPQLSVEPVTSSCCGMAGAFGYGKDSYDISMTMGELSLLPAVRKAEAGTLIVADGTSCRHQIAHGTGREAWHVARVLAAALGSEETDA